MAIRTTNAMVLAILTAGGNYDTEKMPSLTRFIKAANLLTNRIALCASDKGLSFDDETATEVETWLAAHYYTRSDPTYQSRSTQGASGSFHGQTGKGLEASFFGQTALELDPTGCLKEIMSAQQFLCEWGGLAPSEQTDYYLRD